MNIMNSTELKKRISELTEELYDKSMPALTEEEFALFEKTGNRVIYEDSYFKRRKMLAVFGIATIIFGKARDAEKLSEILKDILTETTWALPAHCNRNDDPDWKNTVDLFACETAATLALIWKEAGEHLNDGIKRDMLREISNRVIFPFVRSDKKFGFENATHNWNAVCCGSIGIVLTTVGSELLSAAEIDSTLCRIVGSLKTYVESFPDDGACLEGIGYFNYGMGFFTGFARRLKACGRAKEDLFQNDKLIRIAKFPNSAFFSNGMSVNFSDASMDEKVHGGILGAFSKELGISYSFPESSIADFDTDYCYRFVSLLDDVLYGDDIKRINAFGSEKYAYLPCAEWVIYENNKIGVAVKGGNNDEPHNHNDVGGFIFLSGNRVIASDLGAGEYTKDYFSNGRYDILCNSSLGHSLPVVNGKGQREGKQSCAGGFSVENNEDFLKVSMSLSECYDIPKGNEVKRTLELEKETGILTVNDVFSVGLTAVCRVISKNEVEDKIEVVSDNCGISCIRELFSNHSGDKEKIFIYEIKENKNGNCKEGTESRGFYRITYRLHP